jgi:CheY-like chemotaxis protein
METSPSAAIPVQPKPRFILVVDDDPDLASTVGDVLQMAGYAVAIAGNGLEAIELLRGGARPELILLDMMMPVMDGWGFRAEQAKVPGAADIPVIALTADGDAKRKAESIRADGALGKPVAIRPLLAEIERVCENRGK